MATISCMFDCKLLDILNSVWLTGSCNCKLTNSVWLTGSCNCKLTNCFDMIDWKLQLQADKLLRYDWLNVANAGWQNVAICFLLPSSCTQVQCMHACCVLCYWASSPGINRVATGCVSTQSMISHQTGSLDHIRIVAACYDWVAICVT